MTSRVRKTPKPPVADPDAEEVGYIDSLVHHGQAVEGDGPLPDGATHELIITGSGAKRVKRKRFSAV